MSNTLLMLYMFKLICSVPQRKYYVDSIQHIVQSFSIYVCYVQTLFDRKMTSLNSSEPVLCYPSLCMSNFIRTLHACFHWLRFVLQQEQMRYCHSPGLRSQLKQWMTSSNCYYRETHRGDYTKGFHFTPFNFISINMTEWLLLMGFTGISKPLYSMYWSFSTAPPVNRDFTDQTLWVLTSTLLPPLTLPPISYPSNQYCDFLVAVFQFLQM